MSGCQFARLEKCHPKQVLVIAQSATPVLQVRFLHVNAVAEFLVPRRLVLHAHGGVFALSAMDTLAPELIAKLLSECLISHDESRFQHRRLGQHVLIGKRDGLFNRAGRMPNFEPNIPE